MIFSLTKEYCEFGKSNNYNEVVKSIFAIFEYTFFTLFKHFAENDIFIINNYDKDLTPSDVSEYYFQIREIEAYWETLQYDAEVRIEQLNHTERYGYVYDAFGRRIEKHRLDRDGKPCNRTTFL